MSRKRCAVVGCQEANVSLHSLPNDTTIRDQWLKIIFLDVPRNFSPYLTVCSAHFSADCFLNQAQYNAGFAKKLLLKDTAVPTLLGPSLNLQPVPLSPQTREIGTQRETVTTTSGCQAYLTVPRRTVATQLSKGTLVSIRSHGCQTGPPFRTRSIGVGTDNQGLKRCHRGQALKPPPAKRPWVAITYKDIGLVTGPKKHDSSTSEKSSSSIQTDACRDQQSACLPSLHVSEKRSSSGVHSKDVSFSEHMDLSVLEDVCVNLGCLLQLFQHCERCRSVCTVSAQGDREHFSVLARCKDCSQQTTWSSQPVRVSDEHMEPPESTESNRFKGTGLIKTEKPFVEVDVTIESDGQQSADEDVFGGEEEVEEEEEEEEEMEGLKIKVEVETEGEEMSDSDVEVGEWEKGERENGEIENVENRQLLGISWPGWEDWQTEVEMEDEGNEGWELEEDEDGLDSDFDSDSDSEEKKKKGNVEGSRRPQGTPRRINERRDYGTPLLCPDCGVTYTTYTHKCYDKGAFLICSECGARCVSEISLKVLKMDCRGRTYACKYCLKQLQTWEDKLNHEEQSHSLTEKEPYSCSECPQRFRCIKERRLHFKEHKKIICQTCNKQFPKGIALKRHMLSHSSDKPCKYKMHHSIGQSSGKIAVERCTTCCSLYHCPLCTKEKYKPTYASRLQCHLEVHEKSAIPFKDMKLYRCNLNCREHGHFHCPYCEKTIIRKRDMEGHLKTYSSAPASPVAAPPQSTPGTSISSSLLQPDLPTTPPPVLPPTTVSSDPEPKSPLPQDATVPAQPTQSTAQVDAAQTSGKQLEKVNCPHCTVTCLKRNLAKHIERKHQKKSGFVIENLY